MTTLVAPKVARRRRGGVARTLGRLLGHSLFPFAALTLILGTVVWGPWGTLVLAAIWWNVVTRYA